MAWNKEKIENTLNDLNRRMTLVSNDRDLQMLRRDYNCLLEVLKIIDKKNNANDSMDYVLPDIDKDILSDFKCDSLEEMISRKDLISRLGFLAETEIPRWYSSGRIKKISTSDYIDMNMTFFKNYDVKHYELLQRLLKDNFRFVENKKEINLANGKCYHMFSLNEAYVMIDFRKHLNIATMAHELGHAYEFSMIDDFNHHVNWFDSTFAECYPRFLEFLFLDYYFDSEFQKQVKIETYHLFDSIKVISEHSIQCLNNLLVKDLNKDYLIDESGNRVSKNRISFLISDALAIYMFNLYKYDRDKFEKFIREYHSYKGIKDSLIWNMFTNEEIEEAFIDENYELIRKLTQK